MGRAPKRRGKTPGLPPGSLVYTGAEPEGSVRIRFIRFNENDYVERDIANVEECLLEASDPNSVTWINIEGLSDPKVIERIGKTFKIPALNLEDVLNTDHRPKAEELDELLFIVMKAVSFLPSSKREGGDVCYEQISLFVGDRTVLTFQEKANGDFFAPLKRRVADPRGRFRKMGVDYLFYAHIDYVVDGYLAVLERLGAELETLDREIVVATDEGALLRIHELRNELMYLRKAAMPLRDFLAQLSRGQFQDINPKVLVYLRDAYEHAVQAVDTVDSYRYMLEGLSELHLGHMNQKTNEVIRFLTIFTSIFSPLTFIVGVYGMNFRFMPELEWKHGYLAVWGMMAIMTAAMTWFFRRRRWL
jgi:magnesium transporter